MQYLIISLALLLISGGGWQKGAVDSNGNLIIVELENRKSCRDRDQHEAITVDRDWSILLVYPDANEAAFYIFDNELNRIYKTRFFNEFLRELRNIPNNSFVRKIDKCTVPFDYSLPNDFRDKIEAAFTAKNCTLESKIMYCYCCADSVINKY